MIELLDNNRFSCMFMEGARALIAKPAKFDERLPVVYPYLLAALRPPLTSIADIYPA